MTRLAIRFALVICFAAGSSSSVANAHDGSHSRGSSTRSAPKATSPRRATTAPRAAPRSFTPSPSAVSVPRRFPSPSGSLQRPFPSSSNQGGLGSPTGSSISRPKSYRRRRRARPQTKITSTVADERDSDSSGSFRKWTDSTGAHSIQAKLVTRRDDTLWLRKPNRDLIRISVKQLSPADQTHLELHGRVKRVSLGQPNSELRRWTDMSGNFSTYARLVQQIEDSIWLRKESGELVNLPLSSLNDADQAFVNQLTH